MKNDIRKQLFPESDSGYILNDEGFNCHSYFETLHDIHNELFDVEPVHEADTARRVQHEDHVSLAIADNYEQIDRITYVA